MGKNSVLAHGAENRRDVLMFDADRLKLIEEPGHVLYHKRVHRAPSDAFVASILEHGVLEPVLVRKNGDETEVGAGRKRVMGVRVANTRLPPGAPRILVPAIVKRYSDDEWAVIMTVENEQREDDLASEKAGEMARLVNRGISKPVIAAAFGFKSTRTVDDYLKLLDCSVAVQRAVDAGDVSVQVAARELAHLAREVQGPVLEKLRRPAVAGNGAPARRRRSGVAEGHVPRPRMRGRAVVLAAAERVRGRSALAAAALEWATGGDNDFGPAYGRAPEDPDPEVEVEEEP